MKNSFEKEFRTLGIVTLFLLTLFSCTKEDVNEVVGQKIESNNNPVSCSHNFPFSRKEDLKSEKLENVVDFELVRKISILELRETGLMSDMGWSGCKLSELPVTIYDLNSKPRYYDFIVYDPENRPIGTLRSYAKKDHSTVIEGTYSKLFDYNSLLSKSSSNSPTLFIDWKGQQFIGVKSKFGYKPKELMDQNGNLVKSEQQKELVGKEIIDYMEDNLFPDLVLKESEKDKIISSIPQHMLNNDDIKDEIELLNNTTIKSTRDSMERALDRVQKEAEAYWNTLSEHEKELLEANDNEITSESKFFGRLFRRIFSKVESDVTYISRYDKKKKTYRMATRGHDWCGPWACGYILYVNKGIDKYDFFTDCASSFGELTVLNFSLRLFGRPMTPVEMSWSMPIASKLKIWINPVLMFQDLCAYDQIKFHDHPALRLCNEGASLHWTLAYGARQTGSWLWRNYYFLQIDNGGKLDIPGNPSSKENYQKVDWWNPWLMVWD